MPSPSGSIISETTQIVDLNGDTWTVSAGVVLRGGVATVSKNATAMLYLNSIVYHQNTDLDWWAWGGTGWVACSNPLSLQPFSPNPVTAVPVVTPPPVVVVPPVTIPPVVIPPVVIPTGPVSGKLGMNLSSITDYNDQMFIDVMKCARGFGLPATPWIVGGVAVDANGWPTQAFGVYFLTTVASPDGRTVQQTTPSLFGTYTLTYSGSAKVTAPVGSGTVEGLAYDAPSNTSTAQVLVQPSYTTAAGPQADSQLALVWDGPAQNIKLMRPGYAGSTQMFTGAFLNAVAPFGALRLMDMCEANSSLVTSWSQRTSPTAPTQCTAYTTQAGVAWEIAIELANLTKKDIWINLPVNSGLEYWTGLATLIQGSLSAGLHVYVEYSNELWNFGAPSAGVIGNPNVAQINQTAAISDVASGADTTLTWNPPALGPNENQAYFGYRRIMHQTYKIAMAFKAVFGANWQDTIGIVYCQQYAPPYLLVEDGLAYAAANLADPSTFLYGIACAPYYGLVTGVNPTVAAALASLSAALPAITAGFTGPAYVGPYPIYAGVTYRALANFYGIKALCYECGPEMSDQTSGAINEQAQLDPGMGTQLAGFLQLALASFDLVMFYKLNDPPSQHDQWGAVEDLSVLNTPKYQALMAAGS